jgi:hypothetical protein
VTSLPRTDPPVSDDLAWQDDAACIGYNPEMWFAEGKGNPDAAMAKAICKRMCPVATQCLEYGIRTRQFGIWGGRKLGNMR